MAGRKGKRKQWSIPKQAEEGVGKGIQQGLKTVVSVVVTEAGLASWRWVKEHRQEIGQGVRRVTAALGSRTKRFANRPMQGLQAVINRRRKEPLPTPQKEGEAAGRSGAQ